jgi:hypothetical protein
LVAIAAILSACAAPAPPRVNVASTTISVAVLVSVKTEIDLATTGITVFENSFEATQVPDWHMEQIVLDAANQALSPHYQIAYSEASTQFVDTDAPVDLAFEKFSPTQNFAREHAKPGVPVDLFVVICLNYRLLPDMQGPVFKGVGASKFLEPFGIYKPVAHALLALAILDGASFKEIASTSLRIPPSKATEWPSINAANYPEANLDGLAWKSHWGEYTPDQQKLIHDRIVELLSTSTAYTLKATLGITGS